LVRALRKKRCRSTAKFREETSKKAATRSRTAVAAVQNVRGLWQRRKPHLGWLGRQGNGGCHIKRGGRPEFYLEPYPLRPGCVGLRPPPIIKRRNLLRLGSYHDGPGVDHGPSPRLSSGARKRAQSHRRSRRWVAADLGDQGLAAVVLRQADLSEARALRFGWSSGHYSTATIPAIKHSPIGIITKINNASLRSLLNRLLF
jgi:hypothetical protein